jgi:4'-phosphopantetheinyl transferase
VTEPRPGSWWRLYRTLGDITVLHVDLRPHDDHEAASLTWLDAAERGRLQKFQFHGPKRRFTLCRAALRAVLTGRLECRNERITFDVNDDRGKPFAMVDGVPAPISFNISHSGDHGLIAVSPRGGLGIDVEQREPRRHMDQLIDTVFTETERAVLKTVDGKDRTDLFLDFWTMKEALVKALGTGLTTDPATFEIPPEMQRGTKRGAFRFPDLPTVTWHLDNIGNEAYAAAVACEMIPESV